MTGIKPEVESVTVVEKEQSVIDLFEQYILPQFSCKDKIKIVKADAFDYIKSMDESDFDYCFVDIWDSVADFDVFFKSVEAIRERKFKELKIDFWILESFCTYLTEMYLNTIHYKVLSRMFASFGVDIPAMLPDEPTLMPPETARLEKYVGKLLEGKVFRTPEDVKRCISPKNIAKDIFASDIIFSKC